jgi:hypothetical protein
MLVHLNRALEPVLRDLTAAGVPLPRVEESDWQTIEGAESAMLWSTDGSGMGVWVDPQASQMEQVAMLADQVQDWAFEELAGTGAPTSWPRCPEHPDHHPMEAAVADRTAVWRCPASGRPASEIGRATS